MKLFVKVKDKIKIIEVDNEDIIPDVFGNLWVRINSIYHPAREKGHEKELETIVYKEEENG